MTHEIVVIPGDGIGREVVPAAVEVLEAVAGAPGPEFEFVEADAGDAVLEETGEALPASTYEAAAIAARVEEARAAVAADGP